MNLINVRICFDTLIFSIIFAMSVFSLTACDSSSDTKNKLSDQTPELVSLAESGDLSKVNELLSLGQSPDIQDSCQWTPLMKAAQYGHIDIVKALLKSGALVDQTDKGSYTALLLAASRNHAEIVSLLIQHGADINHQEKTMGWSALIWAAKLNYKATVEVLLAHKADRQLKDFQNNSALMWAEKIQSDEITHLLQSSEIAQ